MKNIADSAPPIHYFFQIARNELGQKQVSFNFSQLSRVPNFTSPCASDLKFGFCSFLTKSGLLFSRLVDRLL